MQRRRRSSRERDLNRRHTETEIGRGPTRPRRATDLLGVKRRLHRRKVGGGPDLQTEIPSPNTQMRARKQQIAP